MASVRGMLARVQRLEAARNTPSPIVRLYGSFDAFAEGVQADIDAGKLDRTGVWGQWHHTGHRVMAQGL